MAQAVQKVIVYLADYMKAECISCIDGTSASEDIAMLQKLEAGVHCAVGLAFGPAAEGDCSEATRLW